MKYLVFLILEIEFIENIVKYGDNTDMFTSGYFVNEDGTIYRECTDNYMDLEYYDKGLSGSRRMNNSGFPRILRHGKSRFTGNSIVRRRTDAHAAVFSPADMGSIFAAFINRNLWV